MKKIISILVLILFNFSVSSAETFLPYLSKNTFIMAHPIKTLSTSVLEEGQAVYFIVPSDLWIDEIKIIPKNSLIKTRVTMLKMPIKGINAAIKLNAEEITFPNGEKKSLIGTVTYKGEAQIGGNLTPPASYNKALHQRRGEYYNGVIAQYVPSGEYEFGQHVTIMPQEMFQIVLDEDFGAY